MKRYPRDDFEKLFWKFARERTERLDRFDLPPTTVARVAYLQGLKDAAGVAKQEFKDLKAKFEKQFGVRKGKNNEN